MLRRLGHEVIALPYQRWAHSESLTPDPEPACDAQLFLSDRLSSVLRLTASDYERLCGDDVDFPRCALWQLLADGLPVAEEYLFLDSAYYQRLRGFAFRIGEFLRTLRPGLAIVQQGCHPVLAIAAAKCLAHGTPFLVYEGEFLPGHILLDPVGAHFFPGQNRVDRIWPDIRRTALTQAQEDRLDGFIRVWREARGSKYAQPEDPRQRAMVEEFIKGGGIPKPPVFFIPDQIPTDANVLLGLGRFGHLQEFIDFCDRTLPAEWRIVLKRHPKRGGDYAAPGALGPRLLAVNDVNIHSLIELSDAVGTFSSSVGFEALLYGKPVVCGGTPFYSRRGFTLDLLRPERDRAALAQLPGWKPDLEKWRRFAYHTVFDYHVQVDDLEALEARLREAAIGNYSNPRAPFAQSFPRYTGSYLRMVDEYTRLAAENLTSDEIVPRLGPLAELRRSRRMGAAAAAAGDGAALRSGERQVVSSYAEAERRHIARYVFASAVLRQWPAASVLDLACGCGYGAHLLAETAGAAVTAVDASGPSIAFASKAWSHERVEYLHASAGSFFEQGRGPYDAVVCFETVEQIASPRRLVEDLWAVLRPGGIMLLSCPNETVNPLDDHPFHVRHFSADALRALLSGLQQSGASVIWGQANGGAIGNVPVPSFLVTALEKLGGGPARFPALVGDLIPFDMPEIPQQRRFYFSPDRFFVLGHAVTEGERSWMLSLADRHGVIVYGPYAKLPEGSYEARFLIGAAGGVFAADAALTIDVASTRDGRMTLLACGQIPLGCLKRQVSWVAPIRFEHRLAGAAIEFRISTSRPHPGARLCFEGAKVTPA
jgi:SAM-dependent methyltransferase